VVAGSLASPVADSTPSAAAAAAAFAEGQRAYAAGDWNYALDAFRRAQRLDPDGRTDIALSLTDTQTRIAQSKQAAWSQAYAASPVATAVAAAAVTPVDTVVAGAVATPVDEPTTIPIVLAPATTAPPRGTTVAAAPAPVQPETSPAGAPAMVELAAPPATTPTAVAADPSPAPVDLAASLALPASIPTPALVPTPASVPTLTATTPEATAGAVSPTVLPAVTVNETAVPDLAAEVLPSATPSPTVAPTATLQPTATATATTAAEPTAVPVPPVEATAPPEPTEAPEPTPPIEPTDGTGVAIAATTTETVNVREAPNLVADVLGVVGQGDTVTVIGDPQDGFYPVAFEDIGGWVAAGYLIVDGAEEAPEAAPALLDYADPTYGFVVGYPDQWRELDDDEIRALLGGGGDAAVEETLANIAFVATSDDGDAVFVITEIADAGTLDEVTASLAGGGADGTDGPSTDEVELDGLPAVELESAPVDADDAGDRFVRQVVTTIEGDAIILTFIAAPGTAADYDETFRQIAASWRWGDR